MKYRHSFCFFLGAFLLQSTLLSVVTIPLLILLLG